MYHVPRYFFYNHFVLIPCFVGLRLTLNVESEEYIGMFSPSVGARITIHPRKEKPFPDYNGFNVAPGFETNVAVKRVLVCPGIQHIVNRPLSVGSEIFCVCFGYHRKVKTCY